MFDLVRGPVAMNDLQKSCQARQSAPRQRNNRKIQIIEPDTYIQPFVLKWSPLSYPKEQRLIKHARNKT